MVFIENLIEDPWTLINTVFKQTCSPLFVLKILKTKADNRIMLYYYFVGNNVI